MQRRKKLERKMKKMKADVKRKTPIDAFKYAKNGSSIQFQSSPKTASATYPEKVEASGIENISNM